MEVGTKDECWYRLQLRLCLQVAWSPGEAEPGWTLELSTKIREDYTITDKTPIRDFSGFWMGRRLKIYKGHVA